MGWRVQLKFQIGLHTKDLNLLYLLQQYLGGIGSIHLARNREIVNYSIDSIEDLNKLIIHLEKYPLLTQKAADFLLFKQVVKLVNNKARGALRAPLAAPPLLPPSLMGGIFGGG
nr:hypothetical protein [Morchella crassipes]